MQRDLSWILNARRIPERPPEELVELPLSLYDYGIPDITSFSRDPIGKSPLTIRFLTSSYAKSPRRRRSIRGSRASAASR